MSYTHAPNCTALKQAREDLRALPKPVGIAPVHRKRSAAKAHRASIVKGLLRRLGL